LTGSKALYSDFVNKNESQIPIFYMPWWLDIISYKREWIAIYAQDKQGDISAIWPLVKYNKLGVQFAFTPILTPHLGPYIFYPKNVVKNTTRLSFDKKVLTELANIIPDEITPYKIKVHPSITNWMPLSWAGFTQSSRYTFQLDITNKSNIRANYTSKLRSLIKNTDDILIEESDNANLAIDLIQQTYNLKKSKQPFSNELFIKLDKVLQSKKLRKLYIAKRGDGTPIACVYTINSNGTIYLPFIGRGEMTNNEGGVIRKLIDFAILDTPDNSHTFDFEGSMVPNFESLFRSFGGELTPYHEVSRVKSKLLKIALMLSGK
jgi:hypothetical protein